jgi:hypothetical protein
MKILIYRFERLAKPQAGQGQEEILEAARKGGK